MAGGQEKTEPAGCWLNGGMPGKGCVNMAITPAKLEALRKEFPFLSRYDSWSEEISIQRADSELLKKDLGRSYSRPTNNPFPERRIVLLNRNGNEICDVGLRSERKLGFWGRLIFSSSRYSEESVGQALIRIGHERSQEVYYVVVKENGYGNSAITIFKPPKNHSLTEWVKIEILKERLEINKTLFEIDNP